MKHFLLIIGLVTLLGCETDDSGNADSSDSNQSKTNAIENNSNTTDLDDQALASPASSETGWHYFRGNQHSTGVATTALPGELNVKWTHEVKNGAFESTPVIVGGDNKRVFIGDADGKLFAFDLESGRIAWEFETKFGFVTAAAFSDGKLYIGDIDGLFYCIDENGNEDWKFQAEGSIDSSANFYHNLVLFGARDTRLYALNKITGEEIWNLQTEDEVRCGITVIDGRAFVAGCDGALHVIDVENGRELGNVVIDSPTGVTPAAIGDRVYFGTEQAGFFSIDWKKIEKKWTYNDDDSTISTRSSPAVSGDHVVFGSSNRTVYSIDPITGAKNWTTELKAGVESSPVIVGKYVFIGATDGRLYRLELESGKIVWQKQFDGGFVGSPAAAFGRLVIATDRGVVYCLGM